MIREGCAQAVLPSIDAGSVQCCVTSPPYWGLRDYGCTGQIGLEDTPAAYVERLVEVFREVRRVLADDGVLWLNLGDSYNSNPSNQHSSNVRANGSKAVGRRQKREAPGLKPKDLVGIPWRVAFALQDDGWYLRSDIIWSKPNPMPESVRDRPTKAHEYLFLLTKRARYYYDADAVREANSPTANNRGRRRDGTANRAASRRDSASISLSDNSRFDGAGRNRRSVWTVAPRPYPGAHFAVMPPALVEPCIKAGSRKGDLILDPFSGAGTVGMVARRLQRRYLGIELNPDYASLSRRRIEGDAPLFNRVMGGVL